MCENTISKKYGWQMCGDGTYKIHPFMLIILIPDVRVGEDYYMTASSVQLCSGL
jgi:hypothetical protein